MLGDAPEIVTVGDVAAASGGKISQADPRLPALIRGATDGIRLLCGWHIAPVITETIILDGSGGRVMQLPSMRVLEVMEVKASGAPMVVDWSAVGVLEARQGCFPSRFRSVEVTLRHGYAAAPAVASVVIQAVLGAAASPMGATREQAGQVAVSWARTGLSLTSDDLAMIQPYRIPTWV